MRATLSLFLSISVATTYADVSLVRPSGPVTTDLRRFLGTEDAAERKALAKALKLERIGMDGQIELFADGRLLDQTFTTNLTRLIKAFPTAEARTFGELAEIQDLLRETVVGRGYQPPSSRSGFRVATGYAVTVADAEGTMYLSIGEKPDMGIGKLDPILPLRPGDGRGRTPQWWEMDDQVQGVEVLHSAGFRTDRKLQASRAAIEALDRRREQLRKAYEEELNQLLARQQGDLAVGDPKLLQGQRVLDLPEALRQAVVADIESFAITRNLPSVDLMRARLGGLRVVSIRPRISVYWRIPGPGPAVHVTGFSF